MSNNVEIKQLFKYNRFPQDEFTVLMLILYSPIGLTLFLLRFILLAVCIVLCYLPFDSTFYQKCLCKLACLALGITVTVENPQKIEKVEAYVSNSLSTFDKVAVCATTGAVKLGTTSNLLEILSGLATHYFGTISDLATLKKKINEFMSKRKKPVYFKPEQKPTNGKGLLKFKQQTFDVFSKVQPVCVSIERPFFDIAVTVFGSTTKTDTLFYMFSPFTNYKLKFLPALERKSLPLDEFVEIVRQNLAEGLKIELTDHSASDVIEWEKRKFAEERQQRIARARTVTTPRSGNALLQRMATQVKEVLPHVPLTAIYNDLSNTRSVDNTITNILEGRVRFTPEPIVQSTTTVDSLQPSTSGTSPKIQTSNSPSMSVFSSTVQFNTAASSFAKSASERTKSFQERKQQLIAAARKRYIEKHNLDIPF